MTTATGETCPRWVKKWLVAAGVYNLVWGAFVVLFPHAIFDLSGLERLNYPQIWQCVGMIVGVYGIGYLVAARDLVRHWPIILVGMLGKIFGPIGFVSSVARGEFPWQFGATIVTNDLIWYPSFLVALLCAWRHAMPNEGTVTTKDVRTALAESETSRGVSLLRESEGSKLLVVFLRHAGCTFCREAIADLGERREEIERTGTRIALVFMKGEQTVRRLAKEAGLTDVLFVADPDRALYLAFELRRGSLWTLFGPAVIARGIAATLRGHLVGKLEGDGFQMPGAFLVRDGAIVRAFRHEHAASRPDYCELAAPCIGRDEEDAQ